MAKAPKAGSKGGKVNPRRRMPFTPGGGHPGPNVSQPPAGSAAVLKAAAAARAKAIFKSANPQHIRVIRHPKAAKAARGLSAGDVCCCVAEALAASLRGEGVPVTDDDVLALHLRIAGPDEYVTIEDGLEAAEQYGLAGVRASYADPVEYVPGSCLILGVTDPAPHAVLDDGTGWWSWGQRWEPWAEPDEAWPVSWQL